MRKIAIIALTIAALTVCKKKSVSVIPCQSDAATTGYLVMTKVTVSKTGNSFLLIPEGAIDTRYNPCNLPAQYAVDKKKLLIEAEIKATAHNDFNPCCTEDIVISKLSER